MLRPTTIIQIQATIADIERDKARTSWQAAVYTAPLGVQMDAVRRFNNLNEEQAVWYSLISTLHTPPKPFAPLTFEGKTYTVNFYDPYRQSTHYKAVEDEHPNPSYSEPS